MQTRDIPVRRISFVSSKTFDETVRILTATIGHPDMNAFQKAIEEASTLSDLQEIISGAIGSSGLVELARFDPGAILRAEHGGQSPKIMRLLVGNPLIMAKMTKDVPDTASYAPVTILIDERADGVHLSFDSLANLLTPYGSQAALAVASDSDAMIERLLKAAAQPDTAAPPEPNGEHVDSAGLRTNKVITDATTTTAPTQFIETRGSERSTIEIQVRRFSFVSSRPFEEIVRRLTEIIGHPDMNEFYKAIAAATTVVDLEAVVKRAIGSSGLIEFARFDPGAILRVEHDGQGPKIIRLLVGRPLIMAKMTKDVPDTASYAPVTILIDERADGVHLSFDSMASLLAPYGSQAAIMVAKNVDTHIGSLLVAAAAE